MGEAQQPLAVLRTSPPRRSRLGVLLDRLQGIGQLRFSPMQPTDADEVRTLADIYNRAFLYDARGRIAAVFKDGRPEDVQAAGYNVVLVYHPHPVLTGSTAAKA